MDLGAVLPPCGGGNAERPDDGGHAPRPHGRQSGLGRLSLRRHPAQRLSRQPIRALALLGRPPLARVGGSSCRRPRNLQRSGRSSAAAPAKPIGDGLWSLPYLVR